MKRITEDQLMIIASAIVAIIGVVIQLTSDKESK